MIKYSSRQRNDNKILTQKCLKKNLKKCLTNKKRWDKINELSERQTQQTLITKQWNTYDSRKFLYIYLKNGSGECESMNLLRWAEASRSYDLFSSKTRDSQTVVLSKRFKHFIREFDPGSGWTLAACLTHASWTGITLLKLRSIWFNSSGGRVSNAWVTCLVQGDNSWKRLLIPHKRTGSHDLVRKTPVVWDGPASD